MVVMSSTTHRKACHFYHEGGTSVFFRDVGTSYQTTLCHSTEDDDINLHDRDNIKFQGGKTKWARKFTEPTTQTINFRNRHCLFLRVYGDKGNLNGLKKP
jgi:hypothetical protein